MELPPNQVSKGFITEGVDATLGKSKADARFESGGSVKAARIESVASAGERALAVMAEVQGLGPSRAHWITYFGSKDMNRPPPVQAPTGRHDGFNWESYSHVRPRARIRDLDSDVSNWGYFQ